MIVDVWTILLATFVVAFAGAMGVLYVRSKRSSDVGKTDHG